MWSPVTLLLLVGGAVAWSASSSPANHAWETGKEYQYLVYSRTLAGLNSLKEQYTGVQLKGILQVQVKSPELLQAKLSNPQYAHIHKLLPAGPHASQISDQTLDYQQIPMSEKPFEIKLKHGVIRDLSVYPSVPTWELNIIKSFVSQLQIDTQGENAMRSKNDQVPINEDSSAMFKAMEDSVGGKCEVLYEITPLSDGFSEERRDMVPFPHLRENGRHYIVKKVKNYAKCQQRQAYGHGINNVLLKEKYSKQDEILSQLSTSHAVISGNLKSFTIQSAVTNNQISVQPSTEKSQSSLGTVYSTLRLTLVKISKLTNPLLTSEELSNLESTGNLVYTYNNPFSDSNIRRGGQPSTSLNSGQEPSLESQESNSAQSSSNEKHSLESSNMPVKASLHQAPNIPLLPMFVGNKGKAIAMSSNVNVVETAKNLISEIANDLQNIDQESSENFLEKYTILRNVIRTLNHKQYAELEESVSHGNENGNENYSSQNDKWSILRDVVTHAGTGPALYTIGKWLKNGKLEGLGAARTISQLPKHVLVPTPEYIQTFFEIATDPQVTQQRYVNVSAPLALAELLRNSYLISQANQKNLFYPIRSMVRSEVNELTDRYIPYLANQLKQGYQENDSLKVQTYIKALGVTGHPKIISVLEKYLESADSTTFERSHIVASLATLVRTSPRSVGPILYKLYVDTREDHEVRCLAVQQYILTNPPLITLQRIAKYTNYDKNQQVNSAVKSTLESIAKTTRSEWQDLANKARSVRYLLNPTKNYGSTSKGYYTDLKNDFWNGLSVQSVGSDNSLVPEFVRVGLNTVYDGLLAAPTDIAQPSVETEYLVSNIKQLINKIRQTYKQQQEQHDGSEESLQNSHVEKLAQMLKIKPEYLNKLEGNIFVNTLYGFVFQPFDSSTIERSFRLLKNLWNKNQKVESSLFNTFEVTVSFPTETGLPFVFSLEEPGVLKVQSDTRKGESGNQKKNGILNTLFASTSQKRFGFVAPFEHQNYIAGIDNNKILQIPVEYKVEYNQPNLGLKIRPNVPQTDSQIKLFHYSNVPFTTRQDVYSFQPVSSDTNTHQVLTSKKHEILKETSALSVQVKADSNNEHDIKDLVNPINLWRKHYDNLYKQVDVLINSAQAANTELRTNIAYDKTEVNANSNEQQSQEEQDFPSVSWSASSGAERRNQIIEGLSHGLTSGVVHVVDINYNIPTSQEQQVLSIGFVNSHANRKSKAYVYWNSQLPRKEGTQQELCYVQQIEYSPNTPLDLEYMLKNEPRDKLVAKLQYGKSCAEGKQIRLEVYGTRSNELGQALENSKLVKQCLEEIQKGNKAAPACQLANEVAQLRDQYEILISNIPEFIRDVFNYVISVVLNWLSNVNVKLLNPEEYSQNDVNIKILMSPFDRVPKIHMITPHLNVSYPYHVETVQERQQQLMTGVNNVQNELSDSCTLDQSQVVTFDNRVYPVTLGAIKHVVMTTYPQQDPDNHNRYMSIPENMGVAVLAEDANEGGKSVTVYLGNQEVNLIKVNNRPEAVVNGQTVEVSNHKSYQDRQDGETILEILRQPDGSIKILSDKYGISAVYDGDRIQLKVSDEYHESVRGLCGNYDSNPDTDFVTPKNCILTKPEEFAATYALVEENSQGPAVENKRKAEQAQCHQLEKEFSYQRNVINDIEAGRAMTEDKNWGYHQETRNSRNNRGHGQGQDHVRSHKKYNQGGGSSQENYIVYHTRVFEEGNELCFTTEPLPTCSQGTRPTERETKRYQLYCQERNAESEELKHRVEQGANPDLSRKPVSRSHVFQVPTACAA